jgi:hypothetical protein
MLTADMKKYRREYYLKNREYLLAYSKWFYRYSKYEKGIIPIEECREKPINKKVNKKKKKDENIETLKFHHGKFILEF